MNSFLWGSATAAYQCEGAWQKDGKGLSNWDDFCHSDKNNVNPVTGDIANDHYNRYEEDIKMMAESNQNAYRFSIAWTRIIPDGIGSVNQKGIDHYNDVIDTCIKYNMEPVITIYHWDMPINIFKNGGWENREIVKQFSKFAQTCFNAFGDRVKTWITINEPSYDTMCCYGIGNYPPNVKDLNRRWKALYHMMLASAQAVSVFREGGYEGKIGLVSDVYHVDSLIKDQDYQEAVANAEVFYNLLVTDLCIKGLINERFLIKIKQSNYDLSFIKDEDIAIFESGIVDFFGANVYTRILVKPYTKGPTKLTTNNTGDGKTKENVVVEYWFEKDEEENTIKNPWGMEVYPKGVFDLLKYMHMRYPGFPIMITENGIGYYDDLNEEKIKDDYRIDFLKENICWMLKAKDEGVNVIGYFVWSTMDLYSWINGYKKRYGLVYIDYENKNKRIPKESYFWYKAFIETQKGEEK